MAALRFEVTADDKRPVTRLGHRYLQGDLHTWRTRASVTVWRDGRTFVRVVRDGVLLHEFEIEAEAEAV